jgi:hypothetical protein
MEPFFGSGILLVNKYDSNVFDSSSETLGCPLNENNSRLIDELVYIYLLELLCQLTTDLYPMRSTFQFL